MSVTVRTAEASDWPAIWEMLRPVFRSGETYAVAPDISEHDARNYWLAPSRRTFVAEDEGAVVGTYYLAANFDGNADHICNCGYVTAAAARGRGVARRMLAHSLEAAREAGFRAMQYNCVVSNNLSAIALWKSAGFRIIATLPEAFRHPADGLVDAYVMWKQL
ncbi:GNAT family N-acetyltransferase [Dinoroseobacter sp. PD6]|uniref:GNAT family N-acetyltransferase n=1 Tax=Dinoroseobacter sp. PD6 TaxID=3028384 RepID=UPI00237B8282|nr:GNAT family N-acetyltransferase [Dinoroseobacter sp. PD6]MDD9717234.1 GNAT family N-acetyltransferase [Dinoroseobacter sp. PD6]